MICTVSYMYCGRRCVTFRVWLSYLWLGAISSSAPHPDLFPFPREKGPWYEARGEGESRYNRNRIMW